MLPRKPLVILKKQALLFLTGILPLVLASDPPVFGQSIPRPLVQYTEEALGRKPLNHYGSLEKVIQTMRAYRPLDLSAEVWHQANPDQDYRQWASLAQQCVATGLHKVLILQLPRSLIKPGNLWI